MKDLETPNAIAAASGGQIKIQEAGELNG
jgi:hypothetical protein